MTPDAYQLAGFFLAQQQANREVEMLVSLANQLVEAHTAEQQYEVDRLVGEIALWLKQ